MDDEEQGSRRPGDARADNDPYKDSRKGWWLVTFQAKGKNLVKAVNMLLNREPGMNMKKLLYNCTSFGTLKEALLPIEWVKIECLEPYVPVISCVMRLFSGNIPVTKQRRT